MQKDTFEKFKSHAETLRISRLTDIYQKRNHPLIFKTPSLLLDGSRNFVNDKTIELIKDLLKETDFAINRNKLFTGEILNPTENRSADHVALRDFSGRYKGKSEIKDIVDRSLAKMKDLTDIIHGKKPSQTLVSDIKYLVSIGIGGSDLGPRMVVEALGEFKSENSPQIIFISNIDDYEIKKVLGKIDLAKTVFVSVSKSLGTQETLMLTEFFIKELQNAGLDHKKHIIISTANKKAPEKLNVHEENCVYFPESIGGRYSLWSSTGFSICVFLGYDGFIELLKGAEEMDHHFMDEDMENNLPVFMGFLEFWYTNFFDSSFLTVNAYTERLALFPMFLQQLQMESNGKSLDKDNQPLDLKSAEVVFGVTGTPAQHSYFQALHQGNHFFHSDFIGLCDLQKEGFEKIHNEFLFANMLAQAQTFLEGLHPSKDTSIPVYKEIIGNKPCNLLLISKWSPRSLGSLIALYEHKTFVVGCLLQINSFDQWGVERGKKIATDIFEFLKNPESGEKLDNITLKTIRYFRDKQ